MTTATIADFTSESLDDYEHYGVVFCSFETRVHARRCIGWIESLKCLERQIYSHAAIKLIVRENHEFSGDGWSVYAVSHVPVAQRNYDVLFGLCHLFNCGMSTERLGL